MVPTELSLDDIENQHSRIAKRLELVCEQVRVNDGRFEHHRPAAHFQKNRGDFEEQLDEDTLDQFEELFEELIGILE